LALRQVEESASNFKQPINVKQPLTGNAAAGGRYGVSSEGKKEEQLTELFKERNLSLPKHLLEGNAP
jgi:hypothetical protein